jgi:hypothetical protein
MRKALLALAVLVALLGSALPPAVAEEAKTPITPLIIDLAARPIESYESAFNQSLRESGPAPRRSMSEGTVLPDGSVQYGEGRGSVIVTVRNPCPEGAGHYDTLPRPLPGRRANNY